MSAPQGILTSPKYAPSEYSPKSVESSQPANSNTPTTNGWLAK